MVLIQIAAVLSLLPSPPTLPLPHPHQDMYGAPFLVGAALVMLAMWVAMALKSDKASKKEDDEDEEESCSPSIPCVSKPKPKKKAESEVSLLDDSELSQT